jgi:hypothetical protein
VEEEKEGQDEAGQKAYPSRVLHHIEHNLYAECI